MPENAALVPCGPCFEGKHNLCDGFHHVYVEGEGAKAYPCECSCKAAPIDGSGATDA